MSNSFKVTKLTGMVVLCLVFAFVLAWGVVGCGDDGSKSDTTVQTDTTTGGGTDTTASGTDTTTGGGTDTTEAGGSEEPGDLVGKWYSEQLKETLEFTADGKMVWTKDGGEPSTFTYEVKMGAVVFTQPSAPEDNTMPYSIAGSTLTVEDAKYGTVTYTRQ